MTSVKDAMLAAEPTPPDEVKPRAPRLEHITISVVRPDGATAVRVCVDLRLHDHELTSLRASASTMAEGWDEALQFVERAVGGVP